MSLCYLGLLRDAKVKLASNISRHLNSKICFLLKGTWKCVVFSSPPTRPPPFMYILAESILSLLLRQLLCLVENPSGMADAPKIYIRFVDIFFFATREDSSTGPNR